MAALCLILWGVDIISHKALRLTISPFTLPLIVIALAVLASTFFTANKVEAFMGRGTFLPALILIAVIIPFLIHAKKFLEHALYALIASGVVLSLISIFQSLGYGPSKLLNRIFSLTIPDTLAFTPAGSPLALIVFLAILILIAIILGMSHKHLFARISLLVISALMGASLILLLVYSWPGKTTAPVFLPLEHGYVIALESLKSPRTALIGFGPESYVVAYNTTRPARINLTPLWNVRFSNGSNELFQIITTLGVVGLFAWVILTVVSLKTAKIPAKQPLGNVIKFTALTLLFLMILVPGTYLYLFLTLIMFLFWSLYLKFYHPDQVKTINAALGGISLVRSGTAEPQERNLSLLPFLTALPLWVIAGALLTLTSQAYSGEVYFRQALVALAKNQGIETYNLERQAITKNPYVTAYRRAYAATNLALANSIAAKENLTDQDRQNVTQLIQQAIREGKVAASLDQANAANWENLTTIYKSLINVAQNADSWTIAALAQAIRNDPLNPRLRLDLGGVYYSLGQYDQAIRFYQQAAELKPDWANAYYNLAAAHKQKKEPAQAYDYLVVTIRYLDPTSADYAKVQDELKVLADELNLDQADQTVTSPPQSDLTVPSPALTPNPTQSVALPEEAALENNNQPLPTTAPLETPPSPTSTP